MVDSASNPAVASPAPAVDQPRGLVRYVTELDDELFAFQREAFPTRRADLVEPRWRWMFQRSAERLGIEPMVWLYRGKQGILAQQGVIPVRLHTRAGECGTGWFVETMVLEQARGKAVGPMLVAKAKQDLPFNLSLGQTAQMRELQYRLGWKRVTTLGKLVFALRGRVALAGKVPDSVAPVAGMALTTWQTLRSWPARLQSRSAFTTRPVMRFGPSHDRLWERVRSAYAVAVVRDASYLNWKYVEQPGQSFTRLEVIGDGDVMAVIVISVAEPDRAYRSRRAILTDIVVRPDHDQHVWAALEATRQYASECGADLISLDIINPALVQRALAFGFARRDPSRVLLIATEDPPSAAGRLALDGDNWLVTRGDSDIDRPW
jgi:hypothetical protein